MNGHGARLQTPRNGARQRYLLSVLLAISAALFPVSFGLATDSITYLGKLTDDIPANQYSLDNYGRIGPVAHSAQRVRVVLFDTDWDNNSAAGRWPVVKALDQFGTWSGLKASEAALPLFPAWTDAFGHRYPESPPMPTYGMRHAHYRSRYVLFVHRVVQVSKNAPHTHLSAEDQKLLYRALRLPTLTPYCQTCENIVPNLPALVVGGYAMDGLVLGPTVLNRSTVRERFDDWRQTISGDDRQYAAKAFNQYVNITVALICHQDGMRPASVCDRSSIKYIISLLHYLK